MFARDKDIALLPTKTSFIIIVIVHCSFIVSPSSVIVITVTQEHGGGGNENEPMDVVKVRSAAATSVFICWWWLALIILCYPVISISLVRSFPRRHFALSRAMSPFTSCFPPFKPPFMLHTLLPQSCIPNST